MAKPKDLFRIRTTADECYCDNCGEPLRVGDEGIDGQRGVYCCLPCLDEGDGHNDGLCALGGADYPD